MAQYLCRTMSWKAKGVDDALRGGIWRFQAFVAEDLAMFRVLGFKGLRFRIYG